MIVTALQVFLAEMIGYTFRSKMFLNFLQTFKSALDLKVVYEL